MTILFSYVFQNYKDECKYARCVVEQVREMPYLVVEQGLDLGLVELGLRGDALDRLANVCQTPGHTLNTSLIQ